MSKPLIPYARQSRKKEHSISVADQVEAMQKWAAGAGVKLTAPVIEEGVSGSKDWRGRALGQAIAACESGEAAGIIVAWQDRLSRENGLATAQVWEALQSCGARLVACCEGLDTDSGDQELTFTIKAAIAREQWKRYRDNWANARRNTIAEGIAPGPAPLGYKPNGKGFVPSADAPLVVEAFKRKARGASNGDIARMLTESGATTAHGNGWSRAAVRHLLGNEVYLGHLSHGEFTKKDAHPALVTASQFRAANRVRGTKVAGERGDGKLLGNGLVRCGGCSQCMCYGSTKATRKDGTVKRYEFMRCINPNCKGGSTIAVSKIEPFLIEAAFSRLPDLATPSLRKAEVIELEERLAGIEYEVETLTAQIGSGEVSPSVAAPLLTTLEREGEQVDAQLRAIGTGGDWSDLPTSKVRGMLFGIEQDVLGDEREVANHVPTARAFLRDLLGTVTVARGKGDIEERVEITGGPLAADATVAA